MALEKNKINEILEYAERAGLSRAAKFFNVSRGSIYNWQKKKQSERNKLAKIIKVVSDSDCQLVMSRIKFTNKFNYCYIYCVKESFSGLEFYAVAENSNYKTPVIFLKYVISALRKNLRKSIFDIKIRNLYGTKSFDKFKNIVPECKISLKTTNEKIKSEAVNKSKLERCKNVKEIINEILVQQLIYNFSVNKDIFGKIAGIIPFNLEKTEREDFSVLKINQLKQAVEYLFYEIELLLYSGDYITASSRLDLQENLVDQLKSQQLLLQFYGAKEKYFSLIGDNSEALDYFVRRSNKNYNSNVKFLIILKICELNFYFCNGQEFNNYLKMLESINDQQIDNDLKIRYEVLILKNRQKKLSFTELERIFIRKKEQFSKIISKELFFNLHFEFCNICNSYGEYKKAHLVLDQIGKDPHLKKNKFLFCQYYLYRAKCFYSSRDILRSFEFYTLIQSISEKYKFRHMFFRAKLNQVHYFLWTSEFKRAEKDLTECMEYAKISSNSIFEHNVNQMFLKYYLTVENLKKACKYADLTYEYAKKSKKIHTIANSLNNCCYCFARNKNNRKFQYYISRYEEINKIIKSFIREMKINLCRGIFLENSGKFAESAEFYKVSYDVAKKKNHKQLIHTFSTRLANINFKQNNFVAALKYADISIKYNKILQIENTISEMYLLKARVYLKLGNSEKALEWANLATSMTKKYKNNNLQDCLKLEEEISNFRRDA